MIQLQGVSRSFEDGRGTLQVLKEVDWQIESGQSIAVMGRSGSGKSTLLNLIGGLDREYKGSVVVDGLDLAKLSDKELARFRNEKIGFIFQGFHLMDQLTVEENVLLPSWFSPSKKVEMAKAKELLERVGLKEKIGQRPNTLSGGEKQRIAIARSLIMEPKLLLCDEPTGNLDEETGEEILNLFQQLQQEDGITLILVTHEHRTAEIAQQIFQLRNGKLELESENDVSDVIPAAESTDDETADLEPSSDEEDDAMASDSDESEESEESESAEKEEEAAEDEAPDEKEEEDNEEDSDSAEVNAEKPKKKSKSKSKKKKKRKK